MLGTALFQTGILPVESLLCFLKAFAKRRFKFFEVCHVNSEVNFTVLYFVVFSIDFMASLN